MNSESTILPLVGALCLGTLVLAAVPMVILLVVIHRKEYARRRPVSPVPTAPFTGVGVVILALTSIVAGACFVFECTEAAVVSLVTGMLLFRVHWVQLRHRAKELEKLRQQLIADYLQPRPQTQPLAENPQSTVIVVIAVALVISLVILLVFLRNDGERGWSIPLGFLFAILLGGLIVVMAKLVRNTADKKTTRPVLAPEPVSFIEIAATACPTCCHDIPAGSPFGLCPRCLIRGAMPAPTSARPPRGVSPIEPPSPAEVGEFFPTLEVIELVGVGGMGAVYKARQPNLDRHVALKIVQSPRGDEDPVFAERFAREARAMAKLDHPNIVTIHESGGAGGLPFLLMEYVDGITLREAMVNRVLTNAEALAVIPQVCDALDFAHRQGVVHRDIKPENILIDQTGRVKIADFGLAKLADPKNVTLTRTQQAMGTPHYMAPEQWETPNEVDHRADIYALGVVLYELLTGGLPLGRFALPSEQGKGDPTLDEAVVRALAKDPAQRYQTAGEMKAALRGAKLPKPLLAKSRKQRRFYEFKSKVTFLGFPLVHVVKGRDPKTGQHKVAKGWIAVGDVMAVGGVAVGGVLGVGGVAVGGMGGLGLIGVGGVLGFGVLGIGGNAAALLFAVGGNAASVGLSIGGNAVGKFAIGGTAWGEYVVSGHTQTPGFGIALQGWLRGFWPL
ncbi:MAG: serine/threonine protein kinase [Fimbriiglobus sp.]|nr:serine/threonine protein kinase [Fimbriiglobus sp.]